MFPAWLLGRKQHARPVSCFLVCKSSEAQSKKLDKYLCKDLTSFSLDTVVLCTWQKQGEGFQVCVERVEQDHLQTEACKRYSGARGQQ